MQNSSLSWRYHVSSVRQYCGTVVTSALASCRHLHQHLKNMFNFHIELMFSLIRVIDNQLINSQNIFIPNLKCFPIWVIAGGDKQIVGLVLAVAVTKEHISFFIIIFLFLLYLLKQNNALRFAEEEDKDGFPQLNWVNKNQ